MITVILIFLSMMTELACTPVKVEGLQLNTLNQKSFKIHDCMPKMNQSSRIIPPKPYCGRIPEATTPRETLAVTFWQPIVNLIKITATQCRSVSVTTDTRCNLFNQCTIIKQTVQVINADFEFCKRILEGSVKQLATTIKNCERQYNTPREVGSWWSTTSSWDRIFCLADLELNVDINLGLVTAPDGKPHTCQYDSGHCNIGHGGILFWSSRQRVTNMERCPYRKVSSEICIATAGSEALQSFLTVSCKSSKTRLHIRNATAGNLEHIESCNKITMMVKTEEGVIVSFNYSSADPSDLMKLKPTTVSIMNFYSLRRLTCTEGMGNTCQLKTEAPDSSSLRVKISSANDGICRSKFCKLNQYHVCSGKVKTCLDIGASSANISFFQIRAIQGSSVCISIYGAGNKQCIHQGAGFTKKASNSEISYSLVSEGQSFHTHFSFHGYTREDGLRCVRNEQIKLEDVSSYREAVHELRKQRADYTEYYVCMVTGTGAFEASAEVEDSPDKSDFVIRLTGKVDSGSFLEAQMGFMYNH